MQGNKPHTPDVTLNPPKSQTVAPMRQAQTHVNQLQDLIDSKLEKSEPSLAKEGLGFKGLRVQGFGFKAL